MAGATTGTKRATMGPHRAAITRMLRATGLLHVPEEAPLVALLKDLAQELDDGGGARTRAAYLSALKDLRRVLAASPSRKPRGSAEVPDAPSSRTSKAEEAAIAEAESVSSADVDIPKLNSLSEFKQRKGITA